MKKLILLAIALCITVITQALTVVSTAGGLSNAIITAGGTLSTVTNLTVTGAIDARDFKMMHDSMPALSIIDLSNVNILAYTGTAGTLFGSAVYPANELPISSFVSKSSLTSVKIPSSVVSIGESAFAYCANLLSVTIPNSVTLIKTYAFYYCTGLPTITIPNSVTQIEAQAFRNCSSLTSLYLSSGLTYYFYAAIRELAFAGCSGLTSIYSYSIDPANLSHADFVFSGVNVTSCILHVPVGYKNRYAIYGGWSDFLNIIDDLPTDVHNATSSNFKVGVQNGQAILTNIPTGETITIYTLQGTPIYNQQATTETVTVNLPAHGVYVVKVGEESVKVVN